MFKLGILGQIYDFQGGWLFFRLGQYRVDMQILTKQKQNWN